MGSSPLFRRTRSLSSTSAMAEYSPFLPSITINVRFNIGLNSSGVPLETFDRPTVDLTPGSRSPSIPINSRASFACFWSALTGNIMGSTQISSLGIPMSLASATVSIMLSVLESTSGGQPLSVRTEMTTSVLYFLARGSMLSLLSVLPEAEFSNGLFLQAFRPASMATGFKVSTETGKSLTSWMVFTNHCVTSSGSFFAGPKFRSI